MMINERHLFVELQTDWSSRLLYVFCCFAVGFVSLIITEIVKGSALLPKLF